MIIYSLLSKKAILCISIHYELGREIETITLYYLVSDLKRRFYEIAIIIIVTNRYLLSISNLKISLGTQILCLSSAVSEFIFWSDFKLWKLIRKSDQMMDKSNCEVNVWPTSLMSEILRRSILILTSTLIGWPLSSVLKGGYSKT